MRTGIAICALATLGTLSGALPAAAGTMQLVGSWSGNGNANDASSLGNNGVFTGSYVAGPTPGSQAFDLGSGKVTIAARPEYTLGNNFQINFDFNADPHGGGSIGFIGQDLGAGGLQKWTIDYNYAAGNAFEIHYNGSHFAFLTSGPVPISGWNSFELLDSHGHYTFFLNGTDIGSVDSPFGVDPNTAPLVFGFSEPVLQYNGYLANIELRTDPDERVAVPEPSSMLLLASGLVATAAARRRRAATNSDARDCRQTLD